MHDPKSVLITGASSGIGAALAKAYAAPGVSLAVAGRNSDRLRGVADACRTAGARVTEGLIDVTDHDALARWVEAIETTSPLELVIASAGITGGHRGPEAEESLSDLRRVLEVNFLGACNTVYAVMAPMRRRRRGQIALISSLNALRGLPYSPAYCASKAALNSYGESLRAWLHPDGIEVTVVMPGFVETPMSARVRGPKPMMIGPERAARRIKNGLDRGRRRIAFPVVLDWGQRALALLPSGPVDQVLRKVPVTISDE
jgi:short-subunit dehydrogenase